MLRNVWNGQFYGAFYNKCLGTSDSSKATYRFSQYAVRIPLEFLTNVDPPYLQFVSLINATKYVIIFLTTKLYRHIFYQEYPLDPTM
jgi:hypothetical protein